ncbi:MAG: type IV secretion system DNA-binding domain-containing protein [Candidatus Staskawiczbacteria bacterium]|nr:type IV secretion system DNA-binding domain-containing protein [Candidatus Staskawiczbacteria bacterium]
MSIIIPGLILVFMLIVLAFAIVLNAETNEKNSVFGGLEMVLFLVMMPKNQPKKEGEQQKEQKIMIAQMEQVFANFLYLKKPRIFQDPPSCTFEIASQIGSSDISFYVAVPRYLESVFEKYVQGVYPNAVVDKIPQDYTIFEPQGATAAAYLRLSESSLFPISTYQTLETDPLSLITNTLSKISANEGGAVQVLIRPLPRSDFRKRGEKALKFIREGKPIRYAVMLASHGIMGQIFEELMNPPKDPKKDLSLQPGTSMRKEQGFDQKGYDAIQSKIQKQPFEVDIRVVASAQSLERADDILNHLTSAFSQFSLSAINSLEEKKVYKAELRKFIYDYSFRNFNIRQSNILNLEELASIYHFPTHYIETPYIKAAKSAAAPPPTDLPEKGEICIGKVNFRNEERKVYFADRQDRRRHLYIIGQTGTGKSGFMEGMIAQDIANGEGVAVVDPHGELVEHVLAMIPKERIDDVVIFEPCDIERPCGLNMLEYDSPEQKDFAVQEMIAIFMKLFPPEIIGPMFEHYMRNAMLALMADKDNPGTLVEIPKMFTDPTFLQTRMAKVSDPVVRSFWVKEWAQTTGSTRSDMLGYVVSKLGRFIENEMMRNIIGQSHSGFDLADIMNNKKIFLANLSKGLTGEVNSSLLGLILISKIQMAAMKRASISEDKRVDFYLYIDEFQNFTTDSIATILSEARKYKLNLIMAHQYMPQLKDEIRDAVLGNVGTIAAMRIGAEDAENLQKQFEPGFSRFDLVNLDNFTMIIKMMINNKISTPFKMQTNPPPKGRPEIIDAIKKISKLKYSRPRAIVEGEITLRSFTDPAPVQPPVTPPTPPPSAIKK